MNEKGECVAVFSKIERRVTKKAKKKIAFVSISICFTIEKCYGLVNMMHCSDSLFKPHELI